MKRKEKLSLRLCLLTQKIYLHILAHGFYLSDTQTFSFFFSTLSIYVKGFLLLFPFMRRMYISICYPVIRYIDNHNEQVSQHSISFYLSRSIDWLRMVIKNVIVSYHKWRKKLKYEWSMLHIAIKCEEIITKRWCILERENNIISYLHIHWYILPKVL
jgi:hypothetical protein